MNKLWFVPIISIVLIIIVGVAGQSSYDNSLEEGKKAISISNITQDIKLEYGYYTGDVSGVLTTTTDYNNINLDVSFYDESGAEIANTNIAAIVAKEVKTGDKVKFNAMYMEQTKPARAIIKVYQDFDTENPIYEKEISIE